MDTGVSTSPGTSLFRLIKCASMCFISACNAPETVCGRRRYICIPPPPPLHFPCGRHCSTSSDVCMFDLLPPFLATQGSWRRRWKIQRWPTSPRNRSTSSDTESSSCPASWSLYLPRTSGKWSSVYPFFYFLEV